MTQDQTAHLDDDIDVEDPPFDEGDEASEIDWGASGIHEPNDPPATGRTVRGTHAALVDDESTDEEKDQPTSNPTASGTQWTRDTTTRPTPAETHVTINNPPAVGQPSLGIKGSDAPLNVEEDGAVMFKNRIIGEFDGATLTINAGWARIAGLGIKVEGDTTDRRRVVFERPVGDHRLASNA